MLDELERLEKAATPGPWRVEKPARGRLYGIGRHMAPEVTPRCIDKGADAWLIAEARNALPALLRVARAARALYADWTTEAMREEAQEMRAALAALEASNARTANHHQGS